MPRRSLEDVVCENGVPLDYSVRFQSGRLVVSDADGNRLVLSADNGDPSSAGVEVTTSDGTSGRVDVPWSIWESSLAFPFDLAGR